MNVPEKRPSLRERQSELTRQEILQAARRLFAERGYTRTSMRDIAEAAGVSAQTVYDSIGSKQALVARLNDLIDEEAGIATIARQAATSSDPTQVAATAAIVAGAILQHCGDIVHALVTGAVAEPELAAALAEGHRRHMAGATMVIGRLRALGALNPELDPETAAETLAAVCDIQVAMLLRDAYGWTPSRIEAWMASTSRTLLLDPGA